MNFQANIVNELKVQHVFIITSSVNNSPPCNCKFSPSNFKTSSNFTRNFINLLNIIYILETTDRNVRQVRVELLCRSQQRINYVYLSTNTREWEKILVYTISQPIGCYYKFYRDKSLSEIVLKLHGYYQLLSDKI